MEITTTSADSTELLKVVETGEDTEAKIERTSEEHNQSMTRSRTAEAPALTQILALITAHQMTIRSDQRRWSSKNKKAHATVLFAYRINAVLMRTKLPFQAIMAKVRILITQACPVARILKSKLTVLWIKIIELKVESHWRTTRCNLESEIWIIKIRSIISSTTISCPSKFSWRTNRKMNLKWNTILRHSPAAVVSSNHILELSMNLTSCTVEERTCIIIWRPVSIKMNSMKQ